MDTTIFIRVKNYDDLIEANLLYLNGKIQQTPYIDGSLDFETEPLIPKLKILHSYGVLTIDSQPALMDPDLRQKSYLEGYVEDHANFIKIFDKIAAREKSFRYQILTKNNHKLTTNFQELRSPLTEEFVDNKWEIFSRSWSFIDIDDEVFIQYPNIESFIKYCGHFLIFIDAFEENSVIELLLGELQSI